MLSDNPNFYPTPSALAARMFAKIKNHNPRMILEPSAGKGDLVKAYKETQGHYSHGEVFCIEVDPVLQATLRGSGHKVIDGDFLNFSGPDKFDLIIANPPFDNGDLHLLKAIDIMYRGEIIFLLNAETIRNPHTNTRKLLARKLDEMGASIEFISNAFVSAERQTGVEIALIHIQIAREIEADLFAGCDDTRAPNKETFQAKHEVATGKTLEELVLEYNELVNVGTEMLLTFFRTPKAWKYLVLNGVDAKHSRLSDGELTSKLQEQINALVKTARTDFWRRTLDLKEVRSRLTTKKQEEFEESLKAHTCMDFTESNVRQFVLNLIGSYEQTLTDAVIDIFDMFTIRHCYRDTVHEKNIHYFNGWKTNNAFKVGRRVVIPIYGSYSGPFRDYGRWMLNYKAAQTLRDIDTVMNYFDGMRPYLPMHMAIEQAFARGQSSGIISEYFSITCHKKGTIHLTFLDPDILRRFNLVACRGKGWLPEDYGTKPYNQLLFEEKAVADAFDGEKIYNANLGKQLMTVPTRLQIAA